MVNFDYNIIKRNQDSVDRSWADFFGKSVFIGVGALVVFLAFGILFKYKHQPERISRDTASELSGGDPEGMAG